MKYNLLLVTMLSCFCAFSQDSAFQIKDYKYRTPGFKALTLNFNFSGNYSNSNLNDANTERRNQTNLGPVSANYFRIRSTEKQLLQTNASFSVEFSNYSVKDPQERFSTKSFQNQFQWNILSRNYRNKQWFLEWGNAIYATMGSGKIGSQTFQSQNTGLTVRNTVRIGVGKGRIEWVQDAQMALFILQDLENENLLNRKPTAEEANVFSQLITDINNRRVFDSRRRRIYELSRLDSFLKASGLVTQTDIRHFTTVNDNWAFAINPFRQSGAAWFVRLHPGVSINRRRTKSLLQPQPDYYQQQSSWFYFTPEIGYEYYRPVNLKWQKNFSISAYYNGRWVDENFKQVRSTGEIVNHYAAYGGDLNLETFYSIGYYPNTRTQITTEVGLQASRSDQTWQVAPSFSFSANYFIGYRTYLTGDLAAWYYYTHFDDGITKNVGDRFAGKFSVRLSHFIF